jgi:hypothetical protein
MKTMMICVSAMCILADMETILTTIKTAPFRACQLVHQRNVAIHLVPNEHECSYYSMRISRIPTKTYMMISTITVSIDEFIDGYGGEGG